MEWMEPRPGQWPKVSRAEYERYRRLAMWRLRGSGAEHLVDDVVSRAMIRWAALPEDTVSSARIEQVIKSEVYSALRSEKRLKGREQRAATDRSAKRSTASPQATDHDMMLIRYSIVQTCNRCHLGLSTKEIEVFELLVAGLSLAEISRLTHLKRHQLRKIRGVWRRILTEVLADPPLANPHNLPSLPEGK